MKAVLLGCLALAISPWSTILAQPSVDWSKAHNDTIINYICWDGTHWTARIQNGGFLHAPNGDFSSPQAHPDTIMNYKTWDGSNWTAKLSGTTFVHAPNGDFNSPQAHPDTIINYLTWDGSHWTAKVNVDLSFQHAPVSEASWPGARQITAKVNNIGSTSPTFVNNCSIPPHIMACAGVTPPTNYPGYRTNCIQGWHGVCTLESCVPNDHFTLPNPHCEPGQ